MKTLTKLFSLAALILASAIGVQAQTALTQTTTSAIVNQGSTSFQVASVTGITGFGAINNAVGGTTSGNANTIDLYIDRELMQVVSVNTTAKTVQVLRGQGGSQASAHASGAMVLAGPPAAFLNYDPEGYCGGKVGTGASPSNPPQYTPWVNQRTGAQFLCSTITLTWTPGFSGGGATSMANVPNTAVASATTIVPTGPLFHLTGTTSVVNITQPIGCNATAVGGCQFTAICDAVCTWSAAGNISVAAGTVVAGTSITFTWDAKNSKWVPSVVT